MTPKLQLSQNVVNRLSEVKGSCLGALYGIMYDSTLLIIGVGVDVQPECGILSYAEIQTHFPTEVDFCGLVTFTDIADNNEPPSSVVNTLKEVLVTDNPLLVKRSAQSDQLTAYFYRNQKLVETEYEVIPEAVICQLFTHVRVRTRLQLNCENSPQAILEAVNNLQKKVSSGTVAFRVENTSVYLFGTEMEGLSPTVGELFQSSRNTEEPHKKKSVCQTIHDVEVLNVSVMQKCTRDGLSETVNKDAPVIHHMKCAITSLQASLPIDALCLVYNERKVSELYNILVDTLCRSLRLFERCLSQSSKPLSPPRAFHFMPSTLGHFFTIVYQDGFSDNELVAARKVLHKHLNLPVDRPIFRRGNAHKFKEEKSNNGPLINPHEGLVSSVKGGVVSTIYGYYSYHHYMQDKMDDNGWGCAYRSLQTIISWFRLQGYTDHPIPTHREIQQCLVDIGDKPKSFVGSRQWIGSTEVSFCLDQMLGITSRILNVSSGSELEEKGGELSHHFNTQGTPIMIGGGVLAHTIIGVDFNKDTGELKFLIVDPHYTGSEDIKTIQSKGWVGWKKPDFWNKSAYYNLCMPLRPYCV